MKRTTLFIALASAVSIPLSVYARGNESSQNESTWSKATERVESMNAQRAENCQPTSAALDRSSSAATGGSASDSQGSYAAPKPSDSD